MSGNDDAGPARERATPLDWATVSLGLSGVVLLGVGYFAVPKLALPGFVLFGAACLLGVADSARDEAYGRKTAFSPPVQLVTRLVCIGLALLVFVGGGAVLGGEGMTPWRWRVVRIGAAVAVAVESFRFVVRLYFERRRRRRAGQS